MPTMQVVGPNGESIPVRGNAQGRILIAYDELVQTIEPVELTATMSRPWLLWGSVGLHIVELAAIGYLVVQLLE